MFHFNISLVANALKHPVDMSFFIADLKYSESNGVKICEIQHGSLSTFKGDKYCYGGIGIIPVNFLKTILQFPGPYWINHMVIADEFKKAFPKNELVQIYNLLQLESDPDFLFNSAQPVSDPYDISSYHGILFFKLSSYEQLEIFRSKFPGIMVMDAAGYDSWVDKYKMSLYFKKDELLRYKPRWNLYTKVYTPELAPKIINDLKCNRFVIKPLDAFRGNGVIVVEKEDLDSVLYSMINKIPSLMPIKDPCIKYWYTTNSKSFIVEEFVSSDPVILPLNGQLYEPTTRVAFLLIYNKGSIHVEYCGAYLRLPPKSLEEQGTLNEKYKDAGEAPYFSKVDPAVYEKIKAELDIALPLIYEQMLHIE